MHEAFFFILLLAPLALADSMNINGFNTSETQIGNMKADISYNGFVIRGSLTDGQPISRNGTDGTFDGQIGWLSLMPGQNITLCGVLMTDTTMNVNLNSSVTCFTFGADNIYLDCNGYTINGMGIDGSAKGIYATGRSNITVKNCEVFGFAGSGEGLVFISTSNSNVTNSIFRNNGANGIKLQTGTGNTVTNTLARTNGVRNFLLTIKDSVFKNLTSHGSGSTGIFVNSYGGNVLSDIVSYSNNQFEIQVQLTTGDVFNNINITNGNIGFYFASPATNILIANSTISAITSIYTTGNVQNNRIINTTFDSSTIGWGTCSPCNFSVSWYARVNVTNSTNPLPADVNVSDINGKSAFSSTAGASGPTPWFTVLDYYASSAGNTFFNNHSINASYPGYNLTQSSFNFGGRDYTFNITLFLTGFIPPLPINLTYDSLVEVFRDLESRKSSEFPARNYFLASLPLLGLAFVGLWKKDWLVS